MVKPPTSVRSIRLPDETWAWIAETAALRGLTVNAYVASVLGDARAGPKGPPNKVIEARRRPPVTPPARPAKGDPPYEPSPRKIGASVPLHKPKAFNPQPKRGKK